MAISGHRTRSILDRYNIVDSADISAAAESLKKCFAEKKKAAAAQLRRVREFCAVRHANRYRGRSPSDSMANGLSVLFCGWCG